MNVPAVIIIISCIIGFIIYLKLCSILERMEDAQKHNQSILDRAKRLVKKDD